MVLHSSLTYRQRQFHFSRTLPIDVQILRRCTIRTNDWRRVRYIWNSNTHTTRRTASLINVTSVFFLNSFMFYLRKRPTVCRTAAVVASWPIVIRSTACRCLISTSVRPWRGGGQHSPTVPREPCTGSFFVRLLKTRVSASPPDRNAIKLNRDLYRVHGFERFNRTTVAVVGNFNRHKPTSYLT